MNSRKTVLLIIFGVCISLRAAPQSDVVDSLKAALAVYEKQDSGKVTLLINLSNYVVWEDTQEALKLANDALDLAKRIRWIKGEAYAYRQVGLAHYREANFLEAMEMSQKALKVNRELGDRAFEASVYNNLGNINSDIKQYQKAQEAYENYLMLSRELNQKDGEVIGLVNRGLVYRELEQYQKAINDLQLSLDIARQEEFVYFEAVILNNLGLTCRDAGQVDEASNYFRMSASLAGSENAMTRSSSLNGLAGIFTKQNKLDSAMLLASAALDLARKTGSLEQERDAWETLSVIYDSIKNETQALHAFRRFIMLRDSILGLENKSELTRKNMQFQMDLKQAVSLAEIQRQTLYRNIAISGFLALVLASVLGYWLYKRRRDALQSGKEAEFQRNVAETELKLLRSQLNPHFIFNSLNSISDYIEKNSSDTAIHYLTKFSKLMRMTLANSEKEYVSVKEDIEWMELYLELEANRLKEKLSYRIILDNAMDVANTLVPPMTLQPFVENSIWHGISPKSEGGHITITIAIEDDHLLYSVEDDGVGRKAAALNLASNSEGSYGIKITENRIHIMNKVKGSKGKLRLTDKEEGLRVDLKLPLELLY